MDTRLYALFGLIIMFIIGISTGYTNAKEAEPIHTGAVESCINHTIFYPIHEKEYVYLNKTEQTTVYYPQIIENNPANSIEYAEITTELQPFQKKYLVYQNPWDTGSMEGVIGMNNTIIAEQNPTDLQIGDIIGAKNEKYPQGIMHRIINITDECITTRGDAVEYQDPICWQKDDVMFKVIGVMFTR